MLAKGGATLSDTDALEVAAWVWPAGAQVEAAQPCFGVIFSRRAEAPSVNT